MVAMVTVLAGAAAAAAAVTATATTTTTTVSPEDDESLGSGNWSSPWSDTVDNTSWRPEQQQPQLEQHQNEQRGGGESELGSDAKRKFNCTMETRTLLEFILYGVLVNVIGFLGIMGNSISVIVLSRPQMKSSINYLLIGLASCDTILIVLAVLLFGLPGLYARVDYFFNYKFFVYPRIVRFAYPLSLTVQMATVLVTLTVTMERYVAVCLPLRARSLCTYGRARTALLVIALVSVVYNIPRIWDVKLTEQWHQEAKMMVLCVGGSSLRQNQLYINVYVHWMYFFVYYLFPFAALVIFNVAIYKNVRKANRDLRQLTRNQRSEIGLATMLLCVVVVFLICNFLPMVSNVYESTVGEPPLPLVQMGNLLVTFNSGVNFIIYVIFGRKFKRIFLKLFCRAPSEAGLDCMGRPNRADSPDFQTNEDSIATNMSNIELRNSVRRMHSQRGLHGHGGSLRPHPASGAAGAYNNGYRSSSSVYYPSSPKPGSQHGQHHYGSSYYNNGALVQAANNKDTVFC